LCDIRKALGEIKDGYDRCEYRGLDYRIGIVGIRAEGRNGFGLFITAIFAGKLLLASGFLGGRRDNRRLSVFVIGDAGCFT
jgi:hypothetical protein